MKNKKNWLFTPAAQISLYALLLIFTPFLMLRNYLQQAIGEFSRHSFQLGDLEIPYLLTAIVISLIILLVLFGRKIRLNHIIAGIVCLLLIYIGQLFADYYFNHRFYDLQHNWHYFAYGFYAFIAFRYFKSRNIPVTKIYLYIFISALVLSTFDEGVQVFISTRIFDISDIAKDGWGAVIGSVFIFYGIFPEIRKEFKFKISYRQKSDYFSNPFTLLFWEMIFAFILLIVASLLSESIYWYYIILITLSLFISIFFLVHLLQFKIPRIVIIILIISVLILQSISIMKHRDEYIVSNKPGLINYKGIPIPFFDIMIFPDNSFRLVDKKTNFNSRDLYTIFTKVDDILLIGSGYGNAKIDGFPEEYQVQFIFNHIKKKGLQVIILPAGEACDVFNRLKKEGKDVLFIIHNSR